jgi:hypothetical protein
MKSGRNFGGCEDSTGTALSYVLRTRHAILTLSRECGNEEGEGEGERQENLALTTKPANRDIDALSPIPSPGTTSTATRHKPQGL